MKNLTPTQKRNLLADLITLKSQCGYDIIHLVGQPLSYFDFEKVKSLINEIAIEYQEMTGHEFYFTYSERN